MLVVETLETVIRRRSMGMVEMVGILEMEMETAILVATVE
jgi:hypothetical protein